MLLIYVAIAVPFRSGFGVDVDVYSSWWFLELCVDTYFISDIFINFRTAYYGPDGIREDRPGKIARRYPESWFFVDLVSSIPNMDCKY